MLWLCWLESRSTRDQGHSNGGGYRYLYPQKSAQVNFYGVKMMSERLFNSFIPPPPQKKTFIPPKQISGYTPARDLTCKRNATSIPNGLLLGTGLSLNLETWSCCQETDHLNNTYECTMDPERVCTLCFASHCMITFVCVIARWRHYW